MRTRILPIGRRQLAVAGLSPTISLACKHCLLVCCLVVAVGCSKYSNIGSAPPPMTLLSGQVLYQGKPLPGGRVIFRTTQDGNTYSGMIDENGAYSATVPAGEAQIGVDNRMLQRHAADPHASARGGAGRRPGGGPAPEEVKGRYVSLPSRYYNPITSGKSLTVEKGSQTYDIKLD